MMLASQISKLNRKRIDVIWGEIPPDFKLDAIKSSSPNVLRGFGRTSPLRGATFKINS